MKKINLYTILALIITIPACYKDKGNYTYSDAEIINISGIEGHYSKISFSEKLIIDPVVTSSDPNATFDCYWGVYEMTNVMGLPPKLDTIARTQNLDYLIKQQAGNWTLVFCAKNRKTGFAKYVTSALSTNTRFTRGWYVIKDEANKTDVDLFLTPSNLQPDSKLENVFELVNGRALNGAAGSMSFMTSYKSMVTGVNNNTRSLFLWSENDMSVVDINTFKEIRDFNSLFYEPPVVKKPASVLIGLNGYFVINNGNLHSIQTVTANTGQFGSTHLRDNNNSPYKLSKHFTATTITPPLFFDENSSSFVTSAANASIMTLATDATGSKIPASQNNKTLLFMGQKSGASNVGWGLLQDKTNPALKILFSVKPPTLRPAITLTADTLSATDQIYHASMYTLLAGDENMIYFVKGNEIWSRNLSNKAEQLQYSVPAGETITFIRHRKYAGSAQNELPYYHNYVMIGTQVGNQYKIRMFTKTAGNLAATPSLTLEGKGRSTDAIYIAPPVSEATYVSF